ncbi:MAG: Outer-membrane lipoprotein carrier protein [Candidatus Celerinatantimonas neptuna]|nr:MAG: Outer-membrane lipoprotein carrier protein [Candidatus Celerinatantimonas neptuna]
MKLMRMMVVLMAFISQYALADAASTLRAKLHPIQQFSANFEQTVISPQGKVIHRASGKLVIAKPGKLNWQERHPEQDQIISNGKTIWYYSPIVEQVSIYNTTDAIAHTPFILLADQRKEVWQNYRVNTVKTGFKVESKTDSQQPSFIISFDKQGAIREFDVVDHQGQRSEFKLSHFNLHPRVRSGDFMFKVPDGVAIDDQRHD